MVKKLIDMPEQLAEQIKEFRHDRRYKSEREAILDLIKLGLEKAEDK